MELPKEILERAERVFGYHQASKIGEGAPAVGASGVCSLPSDVPPPHKPSPYRTFPQLPKVPLVTTLLDLPIGTMSVLDQHLDALPVSQLNPPQTLKTLSTWLHMAYGMLQPAATGPGQEQKWTRTCPSLLDTYPGEIYVAAFAIDGLEPGLYHYAPREFALRKLRAGPDTLAALTRGRPDLQFLRPAPAVLLVSTIFCRSSWRYGKRGYRTALTDAGLLVGNVATVGTALGIQTVVRLHVGNGTLRELIGLGPDVTYGHEEAVQAMIVWGAQAARPLELPPGRPAGALPSIPRQPLAAEVTAYGSIPTVHQDCVAPGFVMRDLRPPLTEMTPLPPDVATARFPDPDDPPHGMPVRHVLLNRKPAVKDYDRKPIPRDLFVQFNRLALRGGSYFPVLPSGPHVGLVRPFWIIHQVTGLDAGLWYYHPVNNAWILMSPGAFRLEAMYMSGENPLARDASAVCILCANLRLLLLNAGPDPYRLAHLEAGVVAQRLTLAAESAGFATTGIGAFYDDEIRKFLGGQNTGWEPLHILTMGVPVDAVTLTDVVEEEQFDWRD